MKFDQKLIDHLSTLSRIKLTSEEKLRFASELSSIADFASIVQAVKTKDEPLYSLSQSTQRMREDEIKKSKDQKILLRNAPKIENGQIKVQSPFNE